MNRLDHLARDLGTGSTRRGIVRLLAGAIPAALLGVRMVDDAAAGCIRPGKRYRKGKKCCPGAKRKKGRCKCPAGVVACGKTCCASGQSCLPTESGGQVCSVSDIELGQICDAEVPASCASGVCGCGPGACTCREETCAAPGASCTFNYDCCEGLCLLLQGSSCSQT